jgi:hypothetical protein
MEHLDCRQVLHEEKHFGQLQQHMHQVLQQQCMLVCRVLYGHDVRPTTVVTVLKAQEIRVS